MTSTPSPTSSQPSSPVITRFAPSPTGTLHLGSARTALFNWLYARHHGGTFLLRIEDTDRERSTPEAIEAIIQGLDWLGLQADAPPIFQFSMRKRHEEVALSLLERGKAYKCFCTPEELQAMREAARVEKRPPKYDGKWRDADPAEHPVDQPYVVRFKAPQEGETIVPDLVQGEVRVHNRQLDDMILLRSDGTPTYMLSVVVDDFDMNITHVLRGDDHLTNTFRQVQLYEALGWKWPQFGHIPLIHGSDGAKLSKRHGALGIETYREDGFLSEALCNYLLRLGWAHEDEEIISRARAITLFDIDGLGKSPSRFDHDKLLHLNGHYIREMDDGALLQKLLDHYRHMEKTPPLGEAEQERLLKGMKGLKVRAKTLSDLAHSALIYVLPSESLMKDLDSKAQKILTDDAIALTSQFGEHLKDKDMDWAEETLEAEARQFADSQGLGFGKLAQPLRVRLTGSTVSPGLFDVMVVLGRDETLQRLSIG